MKRLLAMIAAGAISYGITKWATRPTYTETIQWIDGEDGVEAQPMFYVGDRLHIYNPHLGSLYYEYGALSPSLYTVQDVDYDDEEETFRYLIDFNEDFDFVVIGADVEEADGMWIAEEWLSLPFYPEFAKSEVTDDIEIIPESTPEMVEAERKILGKILDDSAKQTQIDAMLDKLGWAMNYGTDEEITEYKRQLRTMSEGGD